MNRKPHYFIAKHKKGIFIGVCAILSILIILYTVWDYRGCFSWLSTTMNFQYFELFFTTGVLIVSGIATYLFVTSKGDVRALEAEDTIKEYTKKVAEEILSQLNKEIIDSNIEKTKKKLKKVGVTPDLKNEIISKLYQYPFSTYNGVIRSIEAEHIVNPEQFESYYKLEKQWATLIDYEVEILTEGNDYSAIDASEIEKIKGEVNKIIATYEDNKKRKKLKSRKQMKFTEYNTTNEEQESGERGLYVPQHEEQNV